MSEYKSKMHLITFSMMTICYFSTFGEAVAQTRPCPGTESRAVLCRDFRGNVVDDRHCARVGGKPLGTRGCTAQCQDQSQSHIQDQGQIQSQNWTPSNPGEAGGGNSDPLIFDLDGNGITLLSPQDSNVMFDMDNDGVADRTGWVDGTDGILCLDDNRNGKIDNQSEMFGNEESLAYKHLAEYDSNSDGLINSGDRIWQHLTMWVDANVNGVTDVGELRTMADIGVEEIELNYNTVDEIHAGNRVTGLGSFVRQAGHHGHRIVSTVVEALFSFFSG